MPSGTKKHPIKIMDTTLRDGHQSLMATRLKMEHITPILEAMDNAGFESLEVWGGATFDACMRFLDEDPWERLRIIRKHVKNTKLQMLLRGQNIVGYRNYADDLVDAFVEKAAGYGMDVFRIFDALNDTRNMRRSFEAVKRAGKHAQGTISYTTSPVHTLKRFAALARELADMGAHSICIKDMAGQIFPKHAADLVRAVKKAVDLPVQLHSHSCSGMAPAAYYAAAEAGVDIVDTSFSALGGGTSLPPTETIIGIFQGTPYDTGIDVASLQSLTDYFNEMVKDYKDIIQTKSLQSDPGILMHQVPGGMFSNLLSQLKDLGALDKLNEVLQEVPRVRKDLGYPPLVTPTSQIVGAQASMNVIVGERYKNVVKEVENYLLGMYGRPPGTVDSKVAKMVLKGRKPIDCRPADMLEPELDKVRDEAREKGALNDDDLIAYALFPPVSAEYFAKRRKREEDAEKARVAAVAAAAFQKIQARSRAAAAAQPAFGPIHPAHSPWTIAGRLEALGLFL